MIKINTILFLSILIIVGAVWVFAETVSLDENKDGAADQWIYSEKSVTTKIETDANFDQKIDSRILYNELGQKTYEEYDFNYDGKMDDFYYFEKGVLARREIDSNYDEKIDIWITINEGIYIKQIQQDKDFDGKVDMVKNY